MSENGLQVSYWLPMTELVVSAVRRNLVRTGDNGSHLEPAVDVTVAPGVVADPRSRQRLAVEASFLEKVDLRLTFDDGGFLRAVNSAGGRDLSPVLSVVGKVVGLASALGGVALTTAEATTDEATTDDETTDEESRAQPTTLEQDWAKANPALDGHREALERRIGELLDALVEDAPAAELVHRGAALEALQSQLASIGESRRAWIAGRSKVDGTGSWRLHPADLVLVEGRSLPMSLSSPQTPPAQEALAGAFGTLLAIVDPERTGPPRATEESRRDELAVRRSRPVEIGVYTAAKDEWVLDGGSVTRMDVVDDHSPTDVLDLQGSWGRTKGVELSYHPDMSLKTFGVSSAPMAATTASSLGDLVDAATAVREDLAARPTAEQVALERATTQLDLLKTAAEYESLAATRSRAGELAALEQLRRIADSRG